MQVSPADSGRQSSTTKVSVVRRLSSRHAERAGRGLPFLSHTPIASVTQLRHRFLLSPYLHLRPHCTAGAPCLGMLYHKLVFDDNEDAPMFFLTGKELAG